MPNIIAIISATRLKQFRSEQDDVPGHLPALEQRSPGQLPSAEPGGDNRIDFTLFQQIEQDCPVLQEGASIKKDAPVP